jgi:hypothetical protein
MLELPGNIEMKISKARLLKNSFIGWEKRLDTIPIFIIKTGKRRIILKKAA